MYELPLLLCTEDDNIICEGVSSTNVNPSNAPSNEPKYAPRTSGDTKEL